MSAAKKVLDHKLLRSLSPLCDLTPDMLTELSAKSRIDQVVSGATIFKAGDRDHRTLYLISGKLELTDANGKSTRLNANSKQAREPLDPSKPRTMTAVAKSAVALLNIDTELLDMLLAWGSNASYEVSDIDVDDEETDWMSRFLQSRVFLKLRAENIQAMLMRMEEVNTRAGDVIIREGERDDNYFIIAKGSVKVGRQHGPDGKPTKLATFTAGSGFGEEALIANGKRNATVIMQEDGQLMKLAKDDFINLLVKPILQHVSYDSACDMQGPDVQWLDVRDATDFARAGLPEALNIPLSELRPGLRKLNKLHKYIICSNQENRAAAAAFLLCQQGLDAYVLSQGLDAVPESDFVKSAEPEPEKDEKSIENANVVSLHDAKVTAEEEDAAHHEALIDKAKQRVQHEMQRAQAAENARQQAQDEVARLKAEADALRKEKDEEVRKSTLLAISEEEQRAIQERVEALTLEAAERDAAIQRAEAETARAELAEAAQKEAESEIARIVQETTEARRDAEEHTREMAETTKQEAEDEIIRLKAEAEFARQQAEEQARFAADAARTEAERELANQQAEASARHQQELEAGLARAEAEAERAQQAEQARREAEEEAQRMREKAEETQREMEAQARLAADQARSEAEREAARQRAEDLAVKQAEIEEAVSQAEALVVRAEAAEEEIERLKGQAEEARFQAEAQARLAADQARSEVERDMSRQRAEEMASLQAEREQTLLRAEEEARRAKAAEAARIRAESEIQRLKVDAEVARMQLEEQAQRIADVARSEADRESARAQASEKARLQAEAELERLENQVEAARLQAEEQSRLAVDKARSEVEREAARIRAEELASQQAQLEEIARRAEEEAARAQKADEARQRAEREIAKRQMEAEEAERRAEEAERARAEMEQEMARLRKEAQAAREQSEVANSPEDNEAEQRAIKEAAQAKAEAEEIRRNADKEISRLKKEAEAARINSEVELKRTIASARSEVDFKKLQQQANIKARRAEAYNAERSMRVREAREAALGSLGNENFGLDEFLDPEFINNDLDLDVGDFAEGGAHYGNLLDPNVGSTADTPQPEAPKLEQKWLSDDDLWQEDLGLPKDFMSEAESATSSVSAQEGKQSSTSGTSGSSAKQDPGANSAPSGSSIFKFQELDRNIRPQAVKPVGRPMRRRTGSWIAASVVGVLVLATGGWVMMEGPENATVRMQQAKTAATSNFMEFKDTASSTLQSWFGNSDSVDKTKVSDEEKMARLRERMEAIKAQSELEARKQQALEAARRHAQQEFEQSQKLVEPISPPVTETVIEPEVEAPANQEPSFEQRLSTQAINENSEFSFEERLFVQSEGVGEVAAEAKQEVEQIAEQPSDQAVEQLNAVDEPTENPEVLSLEQPAAVDEPVEKTVEAGEPGV